MKAKLTLQEKLRDLRDERKLKLQDVADATGIPLASVQRHGNQFSEQNTYAIIIKWKR